MLLAGRIKLPYQELFVLSNAEITAMIYGHEIDIRDAWVRDRTFAGLIVSPYAKKGYDVRKDFIFSWEDEGDLTFKASKEDFAKAKKMWEIVEQNRAKKNGKSED